MTLIDPRGNEDWQRAKQLTERVRRLEQELSDARKEIEILLGKLDIYRARSNEQLNRRTEA